MPIVVKERESSKIVSEDLNLGSAWKQILVFYSPNFKEDSDRLRPHNYYQLREKFISLKRNHVFREYICLAYRQRLWSQEGVNEKQAEELKSCLLLIDLPEDFDFDLVRDTLAYLLPT